MNAKKKYVLNRVPDAVIKRDGTGAYYVVSDKMDKILGSSITECAAWARAKTYLQSIIALPCGVKIRDSRELGLGLIVQSNGFKRWVRLAYSGNNKFYVSTTGTWLTHEEADEYIAELQLIKQACIEANEYFKGDL